MKKLRSAATAVAGMTLLTGCLLTQGGVVVSKHESGERWLDSNFYTIEHPFTDAGEAAARSRAEQLCGQEKKLAVQSERACSLERCTTSYQCVKPKDAKEYGL
mgnify:CR=1 FL=1|jgi:hypothetical protein